MGGSTLDCVQVQSHFNSKDLSVADLTDSVGALNAKLEEKNQHLEGQLHLMQQHMADLAEQTRQMRLEREAFEAQIRGQNAFIFRLAAQVPEATLKPAPAAPARPEQAATMKPSEPMAERDRLISTCQISFRQLQEMRPPPSREGSSEVESGRRFYSKPSSFRGNVFQRDMFEEKPPQEDTERSLKRSLRPEPLSDTSPLSTVLRKQEQRQSLRRPASMASTTTLVMNDKAKALREEINSLDSEIQQLQRNLKTAINKRGCSR